MPNRSAEPLAVLAEYPDPAALLTAAAKLRRAGYERFDCHSPFPIHGMDEAMGLKRSPLGWIVGLMALAGAALGFALQWWTNAIDYPLVISGKPFFSYQANVPVGFGLAVLFGALSAFFGMLALNRLPQLHHTLFFSKRLEKCSDCGFFISVSAFDPSFDAERVGRFLSEIGAIDVEMLLEGEER